MSEHHDEQRVEGEPRGDDEPRVGVGQDVLGRPPDTDELFLIRHDEEVRDVGRRWRGLGALRARTKVEVTPVREALPRDVENLVVDRVAAGDGDSGKIETLPDGSISIPIYEEELVVTKRFVLKERVIIRKETVTEQQRVDDELRREILEIDVDAAIRDRVLTDDVTGSA